MTRNEILEHKWKIGDKIWNVIARYNCDAVRYGLNEYHVEPITITKIRTVFECTKDEQTLVAVTLYDQDSDGKNRFVLCADEHSHDYTFMFLTKKEAEKYAKDYNEKVQKRLKDLDRREKKAIENKIKKAKQEIASLEQKLIELTPSKNGKKENV